MTDKNRTALQIFRGFPPHLARHDIMQLLNNINFLESTEKELKECMNTLSESDWDAKLREINSVKDEVSKILQSYDDKLGVATLQKILCKRRKKRLRIRKRKLQLQSKRKEMTKRRRELHIAIDKRLESKRQEDMKIKQIKEASEYAKMVLSSVTKKKEDAKNYIQLLNFLKELRRARQIASQSNTSEGGTEFISKINRLIAVWNDAFEDYENEERKLRSILNDTHKSVEDQWKEVLFGQAEEDLASADSVEKDDMGRLIEIRSGWDSCIVPEDYKYGSYIPTGWVLPPERPSSEWKIYLS